MIHGTQFKVTSKKLGFPKLIKDLKDSDGNQSRDLYQFSAYLYRDYCSHKTYGTPSANL